MDEKTSNLEKNAEPPLYTELGRIVFEEDVKEFTLQ